MHYAIIAAGEGSRLAEEGILEPKPLVRLCGEHMIDRLLRIFVRCGATSVSVIVNREMDSVVKHLQALETSKGCLSLGLPADLPFLVVVDSTPSSMHSLAALSSTIPSGPFCLTTVDTIFDEEEFVSYVSRFETEADSDGLFAVTSYVEDEKPLWVGVDDNGAITAFHDHQHQGDCYVSGGIYCLHTQSAFPVLKQCLESGQSRMRNFQRALVDAGLVLKAFPFSKIVDVDHASDILTAECFLKSRQNI